MACLQQPWDLLILLIVCHLCKAMHTFHGARTHNASRLHGHGNASGIHAVVNDSRLRNPVLDLHASMRIDSPVRVVLGIMMHPNVPVAYRNALREGIYKYSADGKGGCLFKHVFWTGEFHHSNYTNERQSNFTDLVDSNLPERSKGNNGKSFYWFRYAFEHFGSDFDFLVKMDTDVAVNWTSLCQGLSGVNRTLDTYFGRSNSRHCGPYSHCPSANCTDFEGKCWVYHSGGFYGFSWSLGYKIVNSKYAQANSGDGSPEDIQTAKWIRMLVGNKLSTVNVVNWNNGLHWCHEDSLAYSHIRNDESFVGLNCSLSGMDKRQ